MDVNGNEFDFTATGKSEFRIKKFLRTPGLAAAAVLAA